MDFLRVNSRKAIDTSTKLYIMHETIVLSSISQNYRFNIQFVTNLLFILR